MIIIAYLFIGGFTASSYAFYMRKSQDSMQATRFTFLMAMTNFSESAAAFTLGRIISGHNGSYEVGYFFASVISLLGLFVLWLKVRDTFQQTTS